MTDLRTAAQQALEALEDVKRRGRWGDFDNLTGTLRAALEADDGMYGAKALTKAYENGWNAAKAEPVQEPVALESVYETIIQWDEGGGKRSRRELARRIVDLHTAPPQRKPLTEEEISNIWDGHVVPVFGKNGINPIVFARAIEAKHGIGGQQ